MTLHNIAEYRKAQLFVRDLEKAIKIIKTTEVALRGYEKYRPVHNILTTLNRELAFLDIFLEQNKIIVETKGERRKN